MHKALLKVNDLKLFKSTKKSKVYKKVSKTESRNKDIAILVQASEAI